MELTSVESPSLPLQPHPSIPKESCVEPTINPENDSKTKHGQKDVMHHTTILPDVTR
ncbi:hypothetical protein C1H46_004594 [Malus baccata]|uniref:Uncharacterized protein n=1 Tax=Malus baccata TaxID=106549 RepID=A0A540NH30_MALBA|nr:hypothetical protein C1H46_004594 [Malus baccata]